ncbi:MAG: DUF86 domain-containing protein [Bifidobacteriaceae bacterium]|nr:DUF86 domain-containing protein [Bifidobacteriaceae bacterium]
MSRSTPERCADILTAIDRCIRYRGFLNHQDASFASMAYDAILRNLGVIGEAVRALPEADKAAMPAVPWAAITGLRNIVVHEYFRIDAEIIADILDNQLEPLAAALRE